MRLMLPVLLMLQAAGDNSCFGPNGEIEIPGVTTCLDHSIGRISDLQGRTLT